MTKNSNDISKRKFAYDNYYQSHRQHSDAGRRRIVGMVADQLSLFPIPPGGDLNGKKETQDV